MAKKGRQHELAEQILAMVRSQPVDGFRRADIRRYVGKADEAYFRDTFKALLAEGKLVRKRGGRYVCAEAVALKQGIIHIHPKGFGFVHFTDGSADAFIPVEETLGALSGDSVLVKLAAEEDVRGPSGSVAKILSRGHEIFVGCLGMGEEGPVVRPLRKELPVSLPLVAQYGTDLLGGAVEGDWVQARLVTGNRPTSPMSAEIIKPLAASGTVVNDLNAIVKEYGLPHKYTSETERKVAVQPSQTLSREDLTALTAVTIDPIDAKDFDDALSLQPGPAPDTVILGVHIADVACFVPPESPLDKQAGERGFTSYLPGRTIPMLPSVLSTDLCSLRAGEDRCAHSVLMTVETATGRILSSRRVHSLIRVTRRLTFEDAARSVAGEPPAELPPELAELLCRLNELACVMRDNRRQQELFLPLALPEYHVLTGGRPIRVQGIARNEATPASEMVEEFMLAANVEVARELQARQIPALYRNHAEPDLKLLADFTMLAGAVLHWKKPPRLANRHELAHFLNSLHNDTEGEVLSMSFLRCLPRAQYGLTCEGHYGLGKALYAQFTSPIRRYPDLLIHQQLLAADSGRPLRSAEQLQAAAETINAIEQNNDQAYFAALDRLKLRYLEGIRREQPGQCYEATVLRATADHLSVYLPAFGLMGIMENAHLGDDRWHYDARTSSLVSHTGQGFRCGSVIYVQVKAIDAIHGDLLLRPVQMSF